MNYKRGKDHDYLLVSITKELDRIGQGALFFQCLGIPANPGRLVEARTRQLFDVELTFENLSCVIETKVDDDEAGRWDGVWQTERIYNDCQHLTYLKQDKVFVFITYGTSEFYIKSTKTGFRKGPACDKFKHADLRMMHSFVDKAVSTLHRAGKCSSDLLQEFEAWRDDLAAEMNFRNNVKGILMSFAAFRANYLQIRGGIDFPINRVYISLPELAFPLFGELGDLWNSSNYAQKLGKVTVYPVSRQGKIDDSILNFTELWVNPSKSQYLMTCNGLLQPAVSNLLYFEINEDFNLHLKIGDDVNLNKVEDVKSYIHGKESVLAAPVNGVRGHFEYYKQGAYVFFEWDFGLLRNLNSLGAVADNLAATVENACKVLR